VIPAESAAERPDRQQRLDLLGVPVDALDAPAVERWLLEALAEPWDGSCRHLVTLNPEYVMAARADAAFTAAIRGADLVVADGVGVVVAARLIHGARLPRVTGVAVTERLVALSGERAAPVFLLGAGAGVADAAASRLVAKLPGASIAGVWDGGSPDRQDDAEALARIRASGARVVLVAYGAAGQVGWIVRNQDTLAEMGVRLAVGVGGAFDFLSGRVSRAPDLVRRLGLEWLYRLAKEPWRWRRQLALPRFATLALLAALRHRLRQP
jgi:N-acetylglucosaminyldiphosphoundecaprenol N-acetyl-beta-D-mannosaminyltransferase